MSKRIGEIKRKPRGMSLGAFFLGTFLGIILGIGAIAGVGVFAYFNVSPEWINNTFHTNLNLGNEQTNKLTLSTVVTHALSIAQNVDTYTINDLKVDFGITFDDEIIGINISDLKSVPLTQLLDKVQEKLSNISAYELREVLGEVAIFDKEMTYYVKGTGDARELYKDAEFTKPVTFAYTFKENNLVVKDEVFTPVEGEVKIALKYLPITKAIDEFTAELGDNVTLRDLHDNYGVDLPKYIYVGNEDKTVNEFTEIINSITIADIMDYKHDSTIGYYLDKNNNGVYDEGVDEKADSLINAIAGSTVDGLNAKISTLTVSDLFTDTSGALSIIPADTPIANLSDELARAMEEKSIDELITKGVIAEPTDYARVKSNMTTVEKVGGGYKTIAECNIGELLNFVFSNM